ncbi:hypothetical protein HPB52_018462 [Rhipicephalus sanguineus]|uniref:Uncharacterized protein n=1 Tax=Rhipicephalus sanguineus TaxID=34632 RepID=A0A9D4Q4H9_RHISA|nr:hypothetical protein HPB52_018462 [Rhipicephalus sanguineus]
MPTFQQDLKDTAVQLVKSLECPIWSLTQSDLIVKLVDKVKQLVQAVKNDTGVEDDGPNRHPPRAAESRDAGAARGPAACAVHTRGPEREGDAWAEASSSLSPQLDADIGAASKRPRPTSIAV